MRRVDATREEEALWSLKSCAASAFVPRHVGADPLELQYREPGPENVVGAIVSVGAGRWEERTFTPSVMK